MKKIFNLFVYFFVILGVKAQTTTIAVNLKVYNINDSIALDLNSDLINDIDIRRYTGVDHTECAGTSFNPNARITSPRLLGDTFDFFSSFSLVYQATMGCGWNSYWTPNTGLRFMGTYFVNSPGDTTFGYITIEFVNPSTSPCIDTLRIYSYTFSDVSNIHLTAGQNLYCPIHFDVTVTSPGCPSCCIGTASVSGITGGCQPYTCSISPIATLIGNQFINLCPDTFYTITVSDTSGINCCGSMQQSFIPGYSCHLNINGLQSIPESCPGCCDGSVSYSNWTGVMCLPAVVYWQNESTMVISGTNPWTNLCAGTYSLHITDNCFICDTIIHLSIGSSTGISALNQGEILEIISTTSDGPIEIINHSIKTISVSLFNAIGQLQKSILLRGNETEEINISDWKNGIYF